LIDPATSGCAGCYVDRIVKAFRKREQLEVAVSRYYPFNYGKRIFYKYSDLAVQDRYRLGRARLYVRFGELVVALSRLLVYVGIQRVATVCYALSSNLWIEYAFLAAAKRLYGTSVVLICHDVVPFVSPGEEYNTKLMKRRKFYRLADTLIVHNQNSIDDLTVVFDEPREKIRRFPFPLYNIADIGLPTRDVLPPTDRTRFLFIGHLRAEKGIDVLLQAWASLIDERQDAELVIAGNIPAGSSYSFTEDANMHITLLSGYLSDEQYVNLIRQADCVVLPYERGTNSAVVSTVLTQRKDLIVSDIDMFRSNPLISAQSFFKASDRTALKDALNRYTDHRAQVRGKPDTSRETAFVAYEKEFEDQVNAVLNEFM
jgi:glycosyltransferase involved in cell wall biosynthesis